MAQNKLTDLAFRNLKATDKTQMVSDGGGLLVRVRAIKDGGTKSFMFDYRMEGKQCRITLKANSLAEARVERDTYKGQLRNGKDPGLERKLNIERARAAQIAEEAELARQQALTNVHGLFERWAATDLQERKDLAEVRRMFAKDVLPVIGELSAQDVRKGHITDVVDRIKQRGSNHTARNLFKLVRQMFKFAVDRDVIEFDPTASLSVTKVTTKNNERDRVLSQDEIRLLRDKLPDAGFMPATECAVWVMLSTLCRVGELSKAEWIHVDFEAGTWLIPAENAKNGKAHRVYLSGFALKQFHRLAELRYSERWLFPNSKDDHHVCEKSITRQINGRQNESIYSHRSKNNQALVLPGGKWTPHDLRRSGATLMGRLGIHSDVIEKCLNHTEENKLKRVYQHQTLEEEQAEAWKVLGERLEILTGADSNVVLFNKKQA